MKSVSRRALPKRTGGTSKSGEIYSDRPVQPASQPVLTPPPSSREYSAQQDTWAHRLYKNMKKAERQELRSFLGGLRTKATESEPGIWQDSWTAMYTLVTRDLVRT